MPSPSRPKVSQFRFLDQRLQDLEPVSLPPSGFWFSEISCFSPELFCQLGSSLRTHGAGPTWARPPFAAAGGVAPAPPAPPLGEVALWWSQWAHGLGKRLADWQPVPRRPSGRDEPWDSASFSSLRKGGGSETPAEAEGVSGGPGAGTLSGDRKPGPELLQGPGPETLTRYWPWGGARGRRWRREFSPQRQGRPGRHTPEGSDSVCR